MYIQFQIHEMYNVDHKCTPRATWTRRRRSPQRVSRQASRAASRDPITLYYFFTHGARHQVSATLFVLCRLRDNRGGGRLEPPLALRVRVSSAQHGQGEFLSPCSLELHRMVFRVRRQPPQPSVLLPHFADDPSGLVSQPVADSDRKQHELAPDRNERGIMQW